MTLRQLTEADFPALTVLHLAYKAAIGENTPDEAALQRLREAIACGSIRFFGCEENGLLLGICSITMGFSTFNYRPSAVFEDFYIRPEWRKKGLARRLAAFAWQESGAGSMTVGCANCDRGMYEAIGFNVPLGNLLAWGEEAE